MLRSTVHTHELFDRYLDQPAELPPGARQVTSAAFAGGSIVAYALIDLDAKLGLSESWLVLGDERAAIVAEAQGHYHARVFERSRIRAISTEPGLSCQVLRLHGEGDGAPLAELYYTQRQRRPVGRLASLLEQALDGANAPAAQNADDDYSQGVLEPVLQAQALIAPNKAAVLWRLLRYLKPYRRQVAWGTSAAFGITVLSMVPPLLTGNLIDHMIGPVQRRFISADAVDDAAWASLVAIAAVYVLRQLCLWARLRLMAELGEFVARDLRDEVYEKLQRLSVSFFGRKKTGSLITRVSSDTDRLWEFLAFGVVEVSLSLVMLLGLGGILVYLDWRLGLVVTLPVPLLIFAIYRNGERMEALFLRAFRKWSRLTDLLSDTIPGMRVVKAFNQERRELERFGRANADAAGEFNRIHAEWTAFWPKLTFGIQLTIVVAWAAALPRLLGTSTWLGPPLSTGTFVSFLLYMTMIVQPIETVGQVARMLHRATSSAQRVFEVLDTEPEVKDREGAQTLERIDGRVEFRDVTFSYDGVRPTLRGISFAVQPGELIGLVGPSGGGKSTLVQLLMRFYDVQSGEVRVDGLDVRSLDSGSFRRQIGVVLQDPYLFHGSIVDNIRYGRPDASLAEVVAAAGAANAHDFVCKLPQGYDTIVGERGHTLSGGERQRLSIARAVLCNPRILILDEATSAVDSETERKIQEALDRLVAGRTVFAIAHRLSTLRRASRLFVIEGGKLQEIGTHAELLARDNGIYRKLLALQKELHDAA